MGHFRPFEHTELTEEWRPVVGFEGRYEVSSLGRVKNAVTGYVLKPQVKKRGYLGVRLVGADSTKNREIARLVALAFLGEAPGLTVNHIDGIKTNNTVANLEYVTNKQNHEHAAGLGLKAWGTRHGFHKLTEDHVREIRVSRHTQRELAAAYGVTRGTIDSIRNRRTWRHLV